MSEETEQPTTPDDADSSDEELGQFDIVYRKKPYFIAETEQGFEIWDDRDLRKALRRFDSEHYEDAEVELEIRRQTYRKTADPWFRRATLLFGVSFVIYAIVGIPLGAGVMAPLPRVWYVAAYYFLPRIVEFAFFACVVAWGWSHRPGEQARTMPRPGSFSGIRALTVAAVAALFIWLATTVPVTLLLKSDQSRSAQDAMFPVPSTLTTVFQVVRSLSFGLWLGCLGGLVLIFLYRTMDIRTTDETDTAVDRPTEESAA